MTREWMNHSAWTDQALRSRRFCRQERLETYRNRRFTYHHRVIMRAVLVVHGQVDRSRSKVFFQHQEFEICGKSILQNHPNSEIDSWYAVIVPREAFCIADYLPSFLTASSKAFDAVAQYVGRNNAEEIPISVQFLSKIHWMMKLAHYRQYPCPKQSLQDWHLCTMLSDIQ